MDKLEPCPNPWCNSMSAPVLVQFGLPSGWRVLCACGIRAPLHPTEAEAITAWNRRSTPALYQRTLEDVLRLVRDLKMPTDYREHYEIAQRDGYSRAIDDIESAILALGKDDR